LLQDWWGEFGEPVVDRRMRRDNHDENGLPSRLSRYRRMIEDMTIRKLGAKTQHDYVQRVKNFAAFLGQSPADAGKEDVRCYQLHLSASGARTSKINSTASALRFFFEVTLDRADLAKQMTFVRWY
jgi:hypothetical protein